MVECGVALFEDVLCDQPEGHEGYHSRATNEGTYRWAHHVSLDLRLAEARAQGRAEILALVAKLPSPIIGGPAFRMDCLWCGAKWRSDLSHPDNDCLFVRAQQAASEER